MKIKHSDGEITESRYATANTAGAWTKATRIDKYGQNIYYLMLWTKYYVFVFNNEDSEWLNYYEVSDSNLKIFDLLISDQFIYFAGYYVIGGNNIGHYSKVPVGSILGDEYFSSTTASTILLSNSDYIYQDDTSNMAASSNTTATTTTSFSEDAATFLRTHYSTTASEISFFLDKLYLQITNSSPLIPIDLSWVASGPTTLVYSLEQHGTDQIPNWITVDASNFRLIVNPPKNNADTTYSFYVVATAGSKKYYKLVEITVLKGSEVEDTEVLKVPRAVKATQTTTVAIMACGMATGIATSAQSGSSSNSFWSMINQFQMVLLLNLLGANLHIDIKNYIEGFEFTNFSFSFIQIQNINFIGSFYDSFSWEEDDEDYELIGIEYKCTVINHFQVFLLLVILILFHIWIVIFHKKFNDSSKRSGRWMKKLYDMWTFTIYLRVLIEGFLFLYLSSLSEIYTTDFSSSAKTSSFLTSVIIFVCLWSGFGFISYIWTVSTKRNFDKETSKFGELFEGLKSKKYPHFFQVVFLSRRILSATWIVLSIGLVVEARVVVYILIQILSFSYLLIIRPFEDRQDNIIEAVNDSIYLITCILLLHYNNEDRWTESAGRGVVALFTINGIIIFLIQIAFASVRLITYCKNKKKTEKIQP
jgi:succinate dehydrogenase hydrophobic anchor subunit